MSFGSGFGTTTSTPAPTFAFGTTPASTATPVKPGKLRFVVWNRKFLADFDSSRRFYIKITILLADAVINAEMSMIIYTVASVMCKYSWCDNFEVRNDANEISSIFHWTGFSRCIGGLF